MKRTKLILLFIKALAFKVVFAQTASPTDIALQEKYQTSRDRYLKNFIAFSPLSSPVNGSGIPINNKNYFHNGENGLSNNHYLKFTPYFDGTPLVGELCSRPL